MVLFLILNNIWCIYLVDTVLFQSFSYQTKVISNKICSKLILCVVFFRDSDMDNFYISLFPCKCPETLRQIYMFGDISLRLWIRKNDRKTKEAVRFITFTLICWDQCREKQTMCRRLGGYFRDNNISCLQFCHKIVGGKVKSHARNGSKGGGGGTLLQTQNILALCVRLCHWSI